MCSCNSIIWRFKQLHQYPNNKNKHIKSQKRHTQYQLKQTHINMSADYPTTGITNPGGNDILCGRGGGTNAHPGNIKFRKLVAAHKLRYLAASKSDKPSVAREVVKEWRTMNPPGRFLAKTDPKSLPPSPDDGSTNKPVVWHDVGDKKAREKASQCLRERNGAANEAVAALVKTVTATGEACPEDYATLMKKAAEVKAQNDLTIQQQSEMLKMNRQAALGNFGTESFEPISLQQQQQYGGGGGNPYQGSPSATEDELIEAEIKRLLQQRQQTLLGNFGGSGSTSNPQGGNSYIHDPAGSLNNSNRSGGGSAPPQAYMGEDSILREYEQLMQKQREYNMLAGKMNMGNNNSGMGINNNMAGAMNSGGQQGSLYQNMHQRNNMGGGNYGSPGGQSQNPNPDAAKDYMNRLRSMRQGGAPEQAAASSSPGYNSGYNGNNIQQQQNFNIEEYQASLQQFLSHGGGNSGVHPERTMSQSTQLAGNLSGFAQNNNTQRMQVPTHLGDGGNKRSSTRRRRTSIDDIDLPIGVGTMPGGRGTFDGNLFASVSSDNRPSFQSMDDMNMDFRGTFRSVDTMDLMSIGNSINEIMDDDMKLNPEMRKKYGRRLSNASRSKGLPGTLDDFVYNQGQTIEFKTSDLGNGGAKKKKSIDPRLIAGAGTRHSVQTKGNDGPSNYTSRGSQLSMNMNFDGLDDNESRMSFGNMSVMSDMTDFQEMMARGQNEQQR